MSASTPASQILARHESHFSDKKVLIAGDFHDDYPVLIATESSYVHCTQFHIYLNLQSRNKKAELEFSLLPPDSFYQSADTLIYYWPKNKTEAQFQLAYLLSAMSPGADIFIVGENRSGVRSAENILADFGTTQKIDTARRCSLYHCQIDERLAFDLNEWQTEYHLQTDTVDISVNGLPGIFSQRNLDAGSELLLDALLDHKKLVKGLVLDMGCGCGVLSAFMAKLNPSIKLTLADVSVMAIESSKSTLANNQIDGKVIASDVFSHIDGRFDLIISNPPFHDGKETSYDAVTKLMSDARQYLTLNGSLCIVANAFLPYHELLAQKFKQVDVIAQTTQFKVYLAR